MITKKRDFNKDLQWQFLILKGRTRHGKNKINQHGTDWLVVADGTFDGQPAWLCQSMFKTDRGGFDSRWITKLNDKNFIVTNWTKEQLEARGF